MIKIKWLRVATASLVLVIILWSTACKYGLGTVCSLNIAGVPFTCPLGFLEAALASRNLLPQLWLGVGLVLLSVVLFGRFFCAWVCPTALLRQIFGTRPVASPLAKRQSNNHSIAANHASSTRGELANAIQPEKPWSAYSGVAVLGGALLSSLMFGFPVFCVICPVGLVFGSIFAVSRLVFANQPSVELLILPALLGFELFAMRSWCSPICPLGVLLGFLARFNHTLRLSVDRDKCLISKGIQCRACENACLYGFNISKEKSNPTVNACAKCFECYENCPVGAIRFGLVK